MNKNQDNQNKDDEYQEEIEDSSNNYSSNDTQDDSGDKKKKLVIAGGVLLLVIGGLFWFFTGDDSGPKKTAENKNYAEEFTAALKKEDENLDILAPTINNQFEINEIKQPKTPEITQAPLEIKIPNSIKLEEKLIQEEERKAETEKAAAEKKREEQIKVEREKIEKAPIDIALPFLLGTEEKKIASEVGQIPTPSSIESMNASSSKKSGDKEDPNDYRARKRNANVLLFGGGDGGAKDENDKKNDFVDLITGRTNKLHTKPSGFAKITDSYVGMKDRMILAGKIIDIVLETRIVTTGEDGMIRAIVSSDVYSESGNNILIPAGSRVIGNYRSGKKNEGSASAYRVEVGLSRIVRPDGIDIILGGAPLTDPLGGSGVRPDKVYTGIGRSIMNSMLIGALSLGTFYAGKSIESAFNKDTSTVINNINIGDPNSNGTNDTTSKTKDESASVLRDIVNDVAENLKSRIDKDKNPQPVFVVNQGKKLNIMMDKDIVFTDENAFVFFPGELNDLLKGCCENY